VFFRGVDLARTITTCPACHARLTFNKEGKCALIKKYALEDPKHVRTYFNELKQHKVPFRTRMQWLSKIYGGRGGYTSEQLYKIVTGKTVGGYYIFPFVKGAPPEVNRILERTYRKHREAGDTKVAAAIAAWTKVKQAGYVKVTKPAPVWTKRRYEMLKPVQVVDYGIGRAMGGLAERGVRGLAGVVKRHPKAIGAFGVGFVTHKELERRRRRRRKLKLGYQFAGLEHATPDIPLSRVERLGKRLPSKKGLVGVGKRVGRTTLGAVKLALVGLAAKELLDQIAKRRSRVPWMPDIRPDVELSGYEVLDQVKEYAAVMPSQMLKTIQAKVGAALRGMSPGVRRGFLMGLLGYITAALTSREKAIHSHVATSPKSYAKKKQKAKWHLKHPLAPWLREKIRKRPLTAVTIAALAGASNYVRELRPGEAMPLPVWGYHPVQPREFKPHTVPRVSRRPRGARLKKVAKIGALPLAALLALRLSKRQEGYSFRSAASKTLRGIKKVGGGLSKTLELTSKVAIPALIVSELWPRKRKRKLQTQPPVLSPLAQPYKLAAVRHTREIAMQKIRTSMTRTRMKQALKLRGKRVQRGMFQLDSVERYPFRSAAQRRWMHWKKPKMAKKWEEHTPEGVDLPEHVSKHALAQRQLTRVRRLGLDRRFVKGRKEKVSKHALQVPLLWRHIRSARQLHKSRLLGKDMARWGREMAARMRKLAASTLGQKITVKGVSTPAPAWFGKEAAKWDAVANQAKDMVLKGQLEKVGLLAAGVAAGAAGHEVGKKRERERVRELVG